MAGVCSRLARSLLRAGSLAGSLETSGRVTQLSVFTNQYNKSAYGTYAGFRIDGICGAPCTPFNDKGDIKLDIIPEYVEHFLDQGSYFAYITGSTGEGNAMTVSERKKVLESWIKHAGGRISLIAHIGTGNIKDSQLLAKHAEDVGADAIACVGPTYYKPENQESYVKYMAEIAKCAPKTPFMLYDIDFVTGINLDVNEFFHQAKDKIPTLQGVKHTSPSFPSMNSIIHDHGRKYQVALGGDETYLQALALGIDSTICNSYMGSVLNRMRTAFKEGDMEAARLEQSRAHMVCSIRRKYGLSIPGGSKAILRATTSLDLGDPRLPLAPITEDLIASLRKDLSDIGYFDWGLKV